MFGLFNHDMFYGSKKYFNPVLRKTDLFNKLQYCTNKEMKSILTSTRKHLNRNLKQIQDLKDKNKENYSIKNSNRIKKLEIKNKSILKDIKTIQKILKNYLLVGEERHIPDSEFNRRKPNYVANHTFDQYYNVIRDCTYFDKSICTEDRRDAFRDKLHKIREKRQERIKKEEKSKRLKDQFKAAIGRKKKKVKA